jgi:hypothetical protein
MKGASTCAVLGASAIVCCISDDTPSSISLRVKDASTEVTSIEGMITRITFGERPSSVQKDVTSDTDIITNDISTANYNFGGAAGLNPDPNVQPDEEQRVTLMRFNLESIPTSRTVVGATLSLYVPSGAGCEVLEPNQVDIFRITEAWDEGDQLGAPGAANRTMRTSTMPWKSPGMGPGSRQTNPSAAFKPTRLGEESQVEITSLVKVWVANPTLNFGFMMKITQQNGDGACFLSSENMEMPERRPQLEVVLAPLP